MAVSQSISLTQGAQSVANNTTQVTFKWTSTQTGESWNGYEKTAYYYVSINGGAETEYSVSYTLPKSSTKTIVNKTFTVKHKDDGKGSIFIRTWMDTGISAGIVKKEKSLTLTTIPRASSLSLSASSVNVGKSITANITRASSSFTHAVEFYINSTYYTKYTNVGTSQSFSIPTSWYNAMPSSSSCTAYCRITTYNGDTQIVGQVSESFKVNVPSTVKPTLGTVSLNPANITTKDGVSRNVLVKEKNKITVSVTDCKPGDGSSIKSYTYDVLKGSTVVETKTTTSTSASFGPFAHTGSLKFRVTVTDKRTRSASNSGSEPTWTCYDYEAPYISAFNAYRANSNGVADINGAYLKCTYTPKYSSVNSTNSVTVTVNYNGKTSNKTLINLGETSATYKVYLTITDNYGGSNKSSTITVFGQSRILNITSDGTGIAIGKMAEASEQFECRWPMKVNDTITFGDGIQGSLYTGQNEDGVNIVYLKTGQSTSAGQFAGIALHNSSLYVPNAGNSGVVNLGSSGRKWNQLYAANGTIETSDKNMKKDIEDMSEVQEQLFNQLKPVTYKMASGTSDRTHYGFISQDVEEALLEIGLEGKDFAGFCKDIRVDDDGNMALDENSNVAYDYSLRYSEFIALNTYMIQKLQNEIAELKAEIKQLKSTKQN